MLIQFFNDSLLYEVLIYYTFVRFFPPINACMTSVYVPIFKENASRINQIKNNIYFIIFLEDPFLINDLPFRSTFTHKSHGL